MKYFKLTAYRKNDGKHPDGRQDKYISLEAVPSK